MVVREDKKKMNKKDNFGKSLDPGQSWRKICSRLGVHGKYVTFHIKSRFSDFIKLGSKTHIFLKCPHQNTSLPFSLVFVCHTWNLPTTEKNIEQISEKKQLPTPEGPVRKHHIQSPPIPTVAKQRWWARRVGSTVVAWSDHRPVIAVKRQLQVQ